MKKVLYIINIIAIILVILFACVSYAAGRETFDFSVFDFSNVANYSYYNYEIELKAKDGKLYYIISNRQKELIIDTSKEYTEIPIHLITNGAIVRATCFALPYQIIDESAIEIENYDMGANAYDIAADGDYSIRFGNDSLNDVINKDWSDKVTFSMLRTQSGSTSNSEIDPLTKVDIAHGAEALVTRLFLAIGDVFLNGIKLVLGSDLTIDNLIFNRYEKTKIAFFGGETSEIDNALIPIVNAWYKILSRFTYIVYVIILVYIGIMIIATTGTPKQDKAKAFFGNWIAGLMILMFVPYYGFPLLFKLNDALVQYVGNGSPTMQTYYNLLEKYGLEIGGGDSYTVLVEKLTGLREDKEKERDTAKDSIINTYNETIKDIEENVKNELAQTNLYTENELNNGIEALKREVISKLQKNYDINIKNGKTHEKAKKNAIISSDADIDIYIQRVKNSSVGPMYDVLKKRYDELFNAFKIISDAKIEITEIDQALESLNKDIMGNMRSIAGSTQRLIYAIIWLMLIFQLIGLTILYFKRVFVIALLIAIFPLIMLFYCIDKMADGAAQTLSMWFKEFLSNIFIQTVHAVIYTVLVGIGLELYSGGTENWLFLVGAMFLILPAEAIMKEIFDLNGSTLSQVGGTFTKFAMGAGALVSLARAGKSEKDASIKSANERRMKRLQNSQNRADTKARTRALKSTYTKGPNGNYVPTPGKKPEGLRESLYHGATNARQAYAKAAPVIGRGTRAVRNVTAVTAGTLYAAAGGDVQSLAQGAAIAQGLSGKTKNLKEKPTLKTEVQSAYKNKMKNNNTK